MSIIPNRSESVGERGSRSNHSSCHNAFASRASKMGRCVRIRLTPPVIMKDAHKTNDEPTCDNFTNHHYLKHPFDYMKILFVTALYLSTLVPAIAKGNGCNSVTIDFNSPLPDGTTLEGGDYLSNEWYNKYGLKLSARGGLSNKPRLFDSAHPGSKNRGDPDLGSPNQRCPGGGGPGVGVGGEPNEPGENCEPLGNVLIIQERNKYPEIPDDNVKGGVMSFRFDEPVHFDKIGLLDIDYKSFLRVKKVRKSGKVSSSDISVPMLGDNSVQTVTVNADNVIQLDLNLRRSGAITFISFCNDSHLAGIGEVCSGDDTCETDYCFNAVLPDGTVPAGVCSCNPETNAGCEDPAECSFSPVGDVGPPECLFPIGETCFGGNVCTTGYCFSAILPDGNRPVGVCSCDPSSNAGCEGSEVCADSPSVDVGPPVCLLPIGEVCEGGDVCATGYCFNAALPDGTIPAGVCSCNPSTNEGCKEEGEECSFSPLVDIGPPGCFLPMGLTCAVDPQCLSDHCFDGHCVCNDDLDFPCADNEVCTFQEGNGYLCLLKIGEPCSGGCETDYCFNAILPGGVMPVGVCSCNPNTNVGCEDPTECAFSPLVEIGPPDCFLPMGSTCLVDSECLSDHCFKDQCVCNEDLDFPCEDDETCTFEEGSGFTCREDLKIIGEECLEDAECRTDFCWADWFIEPSQPGTCRCNYQTNAGCPDDKECLSPTIPGSAPACFFPAGASCSDGGECYSGSCVHNMCTVCNEETNYPCPPDLICVPVDDTLPITDSEYDCVETVGELKSKYLRNDVEAQAFLDNDNKFTLPTALHLAPIGNLQWRIINAMRMTGSDHDATESGETIDAERLRQIDAELVEAEKIIAAQAAKLPDFSDISGPDYLDNIPQEFAAHMYATILELFNAGPIQYQTLSNECLLANIIPQMCGALVDMGVEEGSVGCKEFAAKLREDQIIQSPELFGFNNVRREILDDEYPNLGSSSTMGYVGTLIHEFVHDLDARWSYDTFGMHKQYDRKTYCSPNFVDFAGPFQFTGVSGTQNIGDYVSQYAAGLSNQYQNYRPWEDAAESVESFMLTPNYIRTRARNSTALQAKYDYIRDVMFGGIEFENQNDVVVPEVYRVPNTMTALVSGFDSDFEVRTFRITDIRVRQ